MSDVIDRIASAMPAGSQVLCDAKMTALEADVARGDRYGNCAKDRVVLECMSF
jgi:hypothetical protein